MAGNSGQIKAGGAYVEISATNDKLQKGMRDAQAKLTAFGSSLQSVGKRMALAGLAGLGSFAASLKVFADMGSALNDMSARTGTSVEALSELGFAASMAGDSLEGVEGAIRKMQQEIAGGGEHLAALGLTMADLEGLSPDKQLEVIGERLGDIEDPANRAARAMEIFGKSGTKFLAWADGLAEARAKARELGLTMTTDMAEKADRLGDAFDTLKAVGLRAFAGLGAAIAPAAEVLVANIAGVVKGINEWVSANPGVVTAMGLAAAGVTALGVGIFGLGIAIKGVAIVGAVFSALSATIGGVVGLLGALLNPFLAIPVMAAAAGAAFLAFTETGRGAIASLGASFSEMGELMTSTWGGVMDAIRAGNLALAGQIAMAGLQIAWLTTVDYLKQQWGSFTSFLSAVFETAVNDTFATIQVAWTETVAFLQTALNRFIGAWNNAQRTIAESAGNIAQDVFNWASGASEDSARASRQQMAGGNAAARVDAEGEAAAERTRIEENRAAARQRIEAARAAREQELGRMRGEGGAAGGPNPALEAAQAELQRLTAQAAAERTAAEAARAQRNTEGIEGSAAKQGARGTFNAAAAFGMANRANPVVSAIQAAAAQQNNWMQQIRDGIWQIAESDGAVFT